MLVVLRSATRSVKGTSEWAWNSTCMRKRLEEKTERYEGVDAHLFLWCSEVYELCGNKGK